MKMQALKMAWNTGVETDLGTFLYDLRVDPYFKQKVALNGFYSCIWASNQLPPLLFTKKASKGTFTVAFEAQN